MSERSQQAVEELGDLVCLAASAFSMLEGYLGPQWFEAIHHLELDGPDKVAKAAAAIWTRRSALRGRMMTCCFCGAGCIPLMNIGTPSFELDGQLVPAFCYEEAWMAAVPGGLWACRKCFESRDDCVGQWKQTPEKKEGE